ncbi:MAG: hypothetical protein ACMVO5_06595 [Polymorphobacter sp.]|uniref:hypothetical protein n=1 Tax=Polymorphobacter sp. TaxID=1909290 RepID=UPI003A86C562
MIFTSILGVLTLIALAWALGFRNQARLVDAETAALEAAGSLPRFEPVESIVSDDAKAALVSARDGRTALVMAFGDRYVVRLLKGAEARLEGERLHLRLPEPGFPRTALALGPDAGRWAARL